jgi:eukaryotic-like serine/threonine-protein kinase
MQCRHCGGNSPNGSPFCLTCRAPMTETAVAVLSPTEAPGLQDLTATISSATPHTPYTPGVSFGLMPPGYVFAARYQIERVLGTGGMGAVYQARDQELDIKVALKVIRPDITANLAVAHDFEQRFKQELLMARQVTHRNVIRIHDLGEASGVKYITMQFVEGTDLDSILSRGKIPFERTLSFATQLASGLSAAHDVDVIHRDLKPKNILIDAHDIVYISDFGLAKSTESTMAGLTRTGEILGTPRYISPEQVQGKTADHRSDLYALGTIFFEMASGAQPFSGQSMMELMFQRVQEAPRDLRSVAADVPDYFCRVVMRCLERDPAARYASARDVLHDLEAQQAPPSLITTPVTATRTVSITLPLPTTRRSKIGLAAALVAALAIVVPVTWQYGFDPAGTTQSPQAPATKYVAVLPFQLVGDTSALGPIAAGIEEALSTRLFELPALNVASSAAVERAAVKSSPAAIAKELGVTLLVSGTVQGNGENLRVTVALDDAAAGRRIWAQDFQGLAADLLTIEDQMYARLLTAMDLTLTNEQAARAVSHPTENVDAYRLYLDGRNAMRGQQNLDNVKAAIGFFEQALQKDPGFARAYAGISDGSLRMYRATRENSWAEKALSAAQQARRLDDKLVEAHLSLGSVYQATGKVSEAIAELTQAAELTPNSDDVFRRLGRAYLASGRGDEAIENYKKAVAVNPYYWVSYSAMGAAYMQLGAYSSAVESLKKVIELEPNNVSGHNDLGAAYLLMGRFDESAAELRIALKLQPIPQTYTNLGVAYAYAGKHSDAIPMFEKAVELSPKTALFVGNLADGYRWAGNQVKAGTTYDTAIGLALNDLKVNPRNASARGNLAQYYAKKGDQARARRMIADARAVDQTNVSLMYSEAIIANLGGRLAEALASLGAALKAGYPLSSAQSDPDLRSLSTDPGFKALVEQYSPKKS